MDGIIEYVKNNPTECIEATVTLVIGIIRIARKLREKGTVRYPKQHRGRSRRGNAMITLRTRLPMKNLDGSVSR